MKMIQPDKHDMKILRCSSAYGKGYHAMNIENLKLLRKKWYLHSSTNFKQIAFRSKNVGNPKNWD